ncbi:MAG: enoyl-CoA hydratase-related protein, partial [Pseudomonadota bacterium]
MAETTPTDQSDPDRASDPAPAEEALADGRLLLRRDGPVARVVFNAPERHNAMSLAMWRALGDVAERLAGDRSVRVVALEGAGDRAFVSGADISEFSANRTDATSAARYADAVARAEDAIGALPCPTLALVRGYCIGGGLAIAIRCDLRIADDTARFAVTPGKLGLGYEYGGVAAIV